MKSEAADPLPTPGALLRIWLSLSVQSFGGGPATLALIHRAFVERNRWITEAEFTRDWSLCQIAPGINLFALTILIGRRLDGVRGIVLSLFGLLLPSVVLTILITAFYARLQHFEPAKDALRGIVLASVGLGMVTSLRMTHPLLTASYREGWASLLFSLALLVGSGIAIAHGKTSVIVLLLAGGALGGLFQGARSRFAVIREEDAKR